VQVNLDYADEADMVRKMRVGLALQPVATALFANSPFTDGQPNGFLSYRAEIWRDTDPHRTGPLHVAFEEGFGFERYMEWALDVPMYFVVRNGRYIDMTAYTFRHFLAGKAREAVPDGPPNMGDWENHLSTLFPDVRMKRFLEMRGADAGPWRRICALPALWVGLLYDSAALEAAWELVADWTAEERQGLCDRVPKTALATPFRNTNVLEIAKEVVDLAREGLKRRAAIGQGGFDEAEYLAPLEETVALGKTPAEIMLHQYETRWGRSVEPIFQEYVY
jgi:glutamate--cysteine ligase